MSTTTTTTPPSPPTWPIRKYTPRHPSWPYTPQDFTRHDPSADSSFYASPRFVTHIDDAAIASLRQYYAHVLPPSPQPNNGGEREGGPPKKKKRILDLCSSWTSHFPSHVVDGVEDGRVEVWGLGMNARELQRNPVFSGGRWGVWDLNSGGTGGGDVGVALSGTILNKARGRGKEEEEEEVRTPSLPLSAEPEDEPLLDATTCVVSTDYLTQPLTVFSSLLRLTKPGGSVHLTVSNRCFPTKAIARWLQVDEEERLQMVGDYLFFAGWKRIEIVELSDGRVRGGDDGGGEQQGGGGDGGLGAFMRALGMDAARRDPLWVVRGVKE
ncbi:hypothetical protein D0869_15035 [Hortaea werneckii]|uniref:Methyltransferase type 11 domain-containing protein n=1 Tax=Hortaea werneckii TaxID=91943 RepID=A0A3M6YYA8_HORWE|nr:hypothetical protein KC355_g13275 [Hortaea werneckii]KAI7660692.1 hypothetical protein KC318_g9919 [Hortaea werneckii]RMX72027.1 hypothetical protein D0869_15035 [Hortaea werneckii]RMX85479.1 hypothetical protein D0868_15321 [Hortaea werneckii]RMX93122.1 hypothetical protein D0867_14322 [Hortaea werneckii]